MAGKSTYIPIMLMGDYMVFRPPAPAPTAVGRFSQAIDILLQCLIAFLKFKPTAGRFVFLCQQRAYRIRARLNALAAKVAAGTLAPPRPSRAGRTTTPKPEKPPTDPTDRLPSRRGWMIYEVRITNMIDTRLKELLNDPEMLALLAAAPQLGRIIRPICHMFAVPLSDPWKLPPRPRREPKPRARSGRPKSPRPIPAGLPPELNTPGFRRYLARRPQQTT